MKRKDFLKLAGAAAAAPLLTGCPKAAAPRAGGTGPAKVTVKIFDLKLRYAWGLSRGTWTVRTNAFVRIEKDGVVGLGEAAPIARYNETAQTAAAFIDQARPVLDRDLRDYAVRLAEIEAVAPGEHAAKAALDMAILDWYARTLDVPLWRFLGLGKDKPVTTTYTIGIDEIPVMQAKTREASAFGVFKIKVGTPDDRKIIEGIREVTDKPLRADANEGWKTKEQALEMIEWMAPRGVELIEQPLPAVQLEDYAWLKERSPIPVFADESLIQPSDLPRIAPYFHGVNVKLMKCGGVQEAVRLAAMARTLGLKLMIGCMVETSVGISAGAAVASLFDYADLDGTLLISNDPFRGVQVVGDRLVLGDGPGLGVGGGLF
ncbi:MAG: dipeptide epimerase [Candidatus Aminicenantes bacterium]|nr:dipeptide epimerase [Candidatus Aminicenantes bacterium]NLH75904.1 dipeptide epimerase [Acidobacteriota bacterium]